MLLPKKKPETHIWTSNVGLEIFVAPLDRDDDMESGKGNDLVRLAKREIHSFHHLLHLDIQVDRENLNFISIHTLSSYPVTNNPRLTTV